MIPQHTLSPAFLGKQMQIAFVVKDLQETLRYWTQTMKVGPFVVIQNAGVDRLFFHRGELSPVEMDLAFAYVGDVQIEIICQTNTAPSLYQEFLSAGNEGMHHVAFWPENFEASCRELERTGCELVCSLQAPAGTVQVNYYSGPKHLGVMLEVGPMTPDRARYFGGIKALADKWDGTRPVRTFRSRAEFMASPDCKPHTS